MKMGCFNEFYMPNDSMLASMFAKPDKLQNDFAQKIVNNLTALESDFLAIDTDMEVAVLDYPHDIIQYIQTICVPVILFPGLIGNALSLVVFLWTHLKFQPSSIYLAFLNIADIIYLLTVLPHWTQWLGYGDWLLTKMVWCNLNMFFNACSAFLSIWAVVCLSVERYIVVFYPWVRHRLCNRRKTLSVIVTSSLLASVITSYPLWAVISVKQCGRYICILRPEIQLTIIQVFIGIDTIFRFFVPTVLITVLNGTIGYHIARMKEKEPNEAKAMSFGAKSNEDPRHDEQNHIHCDGMSREFTANCHSSVLPCPSGAVHVSTGDGRYTSKRNQRISALTEKYRVSRERKKKYQRNATRSLLIITSLFLLFNLPQFCVRFYSEYITIFHKPVPRSYAVWQEFALLMYYLNFSVNFLMYIAVSRHFRHGLKRVFARIKSNALKNINNSKAHQTDDY